MRQIVGRDPYELRVAGLDETGAKWQFTNATVSAKDRAAGVVIASKPAVAGEGGWCRVRISAKESRVVRWTLEFTDDQ